MTQLGLLVLGGVMGGLVGFLLGRIQWPNAIASRSRPTAEGNLGEATPPQYERIVSNIPDGVALIDRAYIYQWVNQTHLNRFQKPQSAIVGHRMSEMMGEFRFQQVIKPRIDRCLTGETIRQEEWFDYPEGRRFIGLTYTPYIAQEGTISGVVVTTRDLTELKQAEEDLKESKAFLKQIINVISDTIFVKNEQYQFVLVNQAICHLSGIPEAEFLGRSDYDFFPKEQADHFRQKDQQVFQTQLEDVVEEPLTTLAGETRWLLTKKICFQNQQGQKFLVGSSQDITERKLTESALRQQAHQEQALNWIVQSIRNSLDLDQIFLAATREFAELLQLDLVSVAQVFPERRCTVPIAEHIRKPGALSLLGAEIPDENNPIAARLSQREIVVVENTHTLGDVVHPAVAQHYPVAWLLVPLEVNERVWGNLVGVKSPLPATFTEDEIHLARRFADQLAIAIQQANLYQQAQLELAERQQIETALHQFNQELEQRVQERTAEFQESRDLFKATFQESADAIFLVDPTSLLILDCNQRAVDLFEADRKQNLIGIQGYTLHKAPFSDADLTKMRQEFKIKGVWCQEIEYRSLKGCCFWGNLASKRIQVAGRQMNLVRITDISDRKRVEAERQQAEAALRQSEARFQHLAANIPGIFYQSVIRSDGSRQFHYISSGLQRLLEVEPEQVMEDPNLFWTMVHPEDVESLRAEITRTLLTRESFQFEYRIISPSGCIRWIHNAASREYLTNGDIVSDGVVLDITERKRSEAERIQAERALKASETSFRRLIEDLQVGVVVFDPDMTPRLFNTKMLELVETTAEEMLNSTLLDARWDVIQEDGSPMPAAEYPAMKAKLTRQPVLNVVLGIHRPLSQDRAWLLVTAEPQLNEEGEVQRVIATASDISDRKRAEETLRQFARREHLLRTVTQQIHQSLNLEHILDIAVTEVRQMLQTDRSLIFHLTSDSAGVVLKESVLPEYPSTVSMRCENACFPPQCRIHDRQGNPQVIPDVTQDEWAFCLSSFGQASGVKSQVVAPIVLNLEDTEPRLWGLLIVHSCAYYRQWEPAEVALLQQVANQLAIALQQSALYQKIQTELTERRQIEAQLRASLQEKEILLKEVHHRVKNNLQVISSMLWLQAKATQHSSVFNALADTRIRLQAMALIHETLYESTDLEQLNFHEYIQRLATTILAANARSNPIRLIYHLQPVVLNLETAIPCGLLLNELVSNAVKHAFPAEQAGEICITLEEQVSLKPERSRPESFPEAVGVSIAELSTGEMSPVQPEYIRQYVLTVQDNGVGIPADLNLKELKSLGLKIAYDLALQLRGNLELDCTCGTRFQLTFSALKYRNRLQR
ncbi:MAG: PAS domain S-box protein [Oscillatoriophycideae cyanobacterium NC_groundwater_1537_Pr4_S-0.65um_50_18]|nr:PAS domain S-box protein [Oscillatoriophycideae cyanobacterium NC_groundwater_1537_Pr4_S-0.65um_50_18]